MLLRAEQGYGGEADTTWQVGCWFEHETSGPVKAWTPSNQGEWLALGRARIGRVIRIPEGGLAISVPTQVGWLLISAMVAFA